MKHIKWIALLVITFAAGYRVGSLMNGGTPAPAPAVTEATAQTWTCSMHPQIRQPGPGQCPLCGMDLIPAASDDTGAADGPREVRLSPAARKLAEVETVPVERRFVESDVRMVGKIAYDQTRIREVALLTDGIIERLFVNYVGVPVKQGAHLAEIYSPEVLAATKEMLVARNAAGAERSPVLQSARQKLHLLGVSDQEIDGMLAAGGPSRTFTLFSPIDGVVTAMGGYQGNWVMKGQRLCQVADPSTVWALLDAYESDIGFIHYGQPVALTVEALPGRTVTGFVAFIPPELDDATRSVKVRLNVPNPDGALKPGMFVRALLRARMTADGKEVSTGLAGKWISPMHPEIVKDGPGPCDICGMPLVPAETLGFIAPEAAAAPPLVIPATAPLITGRRAVVYVAKPGAEGVYEGREIELGPRAGDFYVVQSGLTEGERVVTRGNLKIDSAVQILGKTSMMSAGEEMVEGFGLEVPGEDEAPEAFRAQLGNTVKAYLGIHRALSEDDFEQARSSAAKMLEALVRVDMGLLDHAGRENGMDPLTAMRDSAGKISGAEDIRSARAEFEDLSKLLGKSARRFGLPADQTLFVVFCPMAFDNRGADWLQDHRDVKNPYFGAAMLRCGEVKGEIR
jgi:Cu(I)/Ag(I) efflux system membrane fusion protein